ncbi:MAG: heme o synthase [Nitrososphaeria archaeon]
MGKPGAYLNLTKPQVSFLLFLGGITGAFMALRPIAAHVFRFLVGMIGLYLSIAGANALSNYIDRDIDAKMKRTCNRALPSGKLTPQEALRFSFVVLSVGLLLALYSSIYELFWIVMGVIFDPVLYNFLSKRRTYYNILIGSIAGGTPVMAGYSLASGILFAPAPFLLMLLIIIWTPVHIWSIAIKYREDYRNANVPMLPVVKGVRSASYAIAASAVMLFAVAFSYALKFMSTIFSVIMVAAGLVILYLSIKLLVSSDIEGDSKKLFIFSNLYLGIVFVLIIINSIMSAL